MSFFESVNRDAFRCDQRLVESVVLSAIHRAVQIIICSFAVAARTIDLGLIDGIRVDDRADRIVEVEMIEAAKFSNRLRQRLRGQWPARNHDNSIIRDLWDLLAYKLDVGLARYDF